MQSTVLLKGTNFMGGIFGSFSFRRVPVDFETIISMSQSNSHRGLERSDYHLDDVAALGKCSSSISDLNVANNQSFFFADSQVVIALEGKIFNRNELCKELCRAGAKFKNTDDTEVLLHAYWRWGAEFVTHLNGVFAIAIYEIAAEKLYLYRDRLGEKPLYLAGSPEEGLIWFGSDLKSILGNGRSYSPDIDAFAQFFALNYIPEPQTAFSGITCLLPGHMACVSINGGLKISRYWDLKSIKPDPQMTEAAAKSGFLMHLDDATRIRMDSNGHVGALLSGDLDSSSVVGMMNLYEADALSTFSVSLGESSFSKIASIRFGTLHERQAADCSMTGFWSNIIWNCNQPCGAVSSMLINQVARLAARQVKIVFTGIGGSQLYAVNERHLDFFSCKKFNRLKANWEDDYARLFSPLQGDESRALLTGELHDAFHDTDPYKAFSAEIRRAEHQDPINQVLFAEINTRLPSNKLLKINLLAAANSLEVRSPFLDHRMAEHAFTIPGEFKLRSGQNKWIYKRAIEPLLGEEITWRDKQFSPESSKKLSDCLFVANYQDILLDGRLEARGIVSMRRVIDMVALHLAGTVDYDLQLRALMSVEIWFRLFIDHDESYITVPETIKNRFNRESES